MEKDLTELARRMKYFMDNYDCAYTYVHNVGETQAIVDYQDKVCRFCGKRYPEVKFRKKAHAISELVGNKEFVLRNECDECNIFFGHKLEDDFGKYLGLGRTLSQIFGKEGIPSYKDRSGSWRIDWTNKGLVIQMKPDCTGVEQHEDYMIFHAVRDTYSPIAVYKALVKMALSLLPYEKMPFFLDTVAWLKEESHLVSKYNMDNYAYMIERFVPGPRPLELRASGFIRKFDSYAVPYYQFLLEFGNYSYQIMVPCKTKDGLLEKVGQVDFVQIPGTDETAFMQSIFGESSSKLVDMRKKEKVKNECFDFCLSFEKSEEHNEEGRKIDEVLKEEGIELEKRLK